MQSFYTVLATALLLVSSTQAAVLPRQDVSISADSLKTLANDASTLGSTISGGASSLRGQIDAFASSGQLGAGLGALSSTFDGQVTDLLNTLSTLSSALSSASGTFSDEEQNIGDVLGGFRA